MARFICDNHIKHLSPIKMIKLIIINEYCKCNAIFPRMGQKTKFCQYVFVQSFLHLFNEWIIFPHVIQFTFFLKMKMPKKIDIFRFTETTILFEFHWLFPYFSWSHQFLTIFESSVFRLIFKKIDYNSIIRTGLILHGNRH